MKGYSFDELVKLAMAAVKRDGDTMTGNLTAPTFTGDLVGNAATATKLATARQINGTNFDGSGNITTANWGAARTMTIGNAGKSVNGGADVAWSLDEIGALPSSSYKPRADSLSSSAGLIGTVEAGDMDTRPAGDFALFNGGTVKNSPYNTYFYCETKSIYHIGALLQTAWPYDGEGGVYHRNYSLNTRSWTPWQRVYDTNNKPTAADVGALSIAGGEMMGAVTFSGSANLLNVAEGAKIRYFNGDSTWFYTSVNAAGEFEVSTGGVGETSIATIDYTGKIRTSNQGILYGDRSKPTAADVGALPYANAEVTSPVRFKSLSGLFTAGSWQPIEMGHLQGTPGTFYVDIHTDGTADAQDFRYRWSYFDDSSFGALFSGNLKVDGHLHGHGGVVAGLGNQGQISINGDHATSSLAFTFAGVNRFVTQLDASGHLATHRYDISTGAYIGTPHIIYSSGVTSMQDPRVNGPQGATADALTRKDYVDGEIAKQVSKSGDTMTGNLFAPAVLVSSAQNASPNALTRKDYVDAKVDAKGLAQGGHGQGGTSVTFSTTGKTMAVAYLAANGRVYPVTFAIASAVQHGVNVPNRGGENADKDFDLRVAVSVSGNNMTLTTIAGNRCNGIWQVYTM